MTWTSTMSSGYSSLEEDCEEYFFTARTSFFKKPSGKLTDPKTNCHWGGFTQLQTLLLSPPVSLCACTSSHKDTPAAFCITSPSFSQHEVNQSVHKIAPLPKALDKHCPLAPGFRAAPA
ncbi:ras association domain-containing protein 3 isoform X2 [Tachysurus ichikawai]